MLVQEVAAESVAHNSWLQCATRVLRQRRIHRAEILLETAQGAVIHHQGRGEGLLHGVTAHSLLCVCACLQKAARKGRTHEDWQQQRRHAEAAKTSHTEME